MATTDLGELIERLRDHIIGALHVGELESGERLPSIREVARRMGADQRKVARAYRALEGEGLVEIRGRSGVYAIPQARLDGGMLEETAEWLAGVLLEAWKRRIPLPDLPALVAKHATEVPVRCAFVDSCTDAIEAFAYDLREDLGLQVAPIWLHTLHRPDDAPGDGGIVYPDALRDADLIATTIFSATTVRTLAQRLGKPIITVYIHPHVVAAVVDRLRRGSLTLICVDPSFGDRIRLQYSEHIRGDAHLRVVLADDRAAIAKLDRAEPVLLTRAARDRLGELGLKMLTPHSPTLAPASAHQIIRSMIRMGPRLST